MKVKRTKAMLLLLTALLPMVANAYDAEIDGIFYNFSGNEATVTEDDENYDYSYSGDAVIPASVTYNDKTYSVTSIGDYAFNCWEYLTSVTIPNSVTSIGIQAFDGCCSLTSVSIGNGVTSIGDGAFSNCSNLTSVTIPNSVTSIGDYAFDSCYDLTSVSIGNGVTCIGDRAFCRCYDLTSVTIPNSVTSIGEGAFLNCGLTSVTIPSSVTSVGEDAFEDCTSLKSVTIYTASPDIYDGYVFNNNASGRKIYVFNNCLETYKDWWYDYAADILPITLTAREGETDEFWTTYYNDMADTMTPDGTEVFKVSMEGTTLTLTPIEDGIVNRGEGVILKSSTASILPNYSALVSDDDYAGNVLRGTMTSITNPGNAYVLNKTAEMGVGFFKLSSSGTIGAGKAYLTYSGAEVREFFGFEENATSIFDLRFTSHNGADTWYSLDGRKLSGKPTHQSIYIHNGRKEAQK